MGRDELDYGVERGLSKCKVDDEEEGNGKLSFKGAINANPIWNEVDAVKKNRVYFLPKRLFHFRPNKDYLEAYKMLAELLYPGVTF